MIFAFFHAPSRLSRDLQLVAAHRLCCLAAPLHHLDCHSNRRLASIHVSRQTWTEKMRKRVTNNVIFQSCPDGPWPILFTFRSKVLRSLLLCRNASQKCFLRSSGVRVILCQPMPGVGVNGSPTDLDYTNGGIRSLCGCLLFALSDMISRLYLQKVELKRSSCIASSVG